MTRNAPDYFQYVSSAACQPDPGATGPSPRADLPAADGISVREFPATPENLATWAAYFALFNNHSLGDK